MRHNLTLLEIGWLCPALLSLLRSSPQSIHSDQNSQTLLRLLNESAECSKWPPPAAQGNGEQISVALERVLRGTATNPAQRINLSQKLGQFKAATAAKFRADGKKQKGSKEGLGSHGSHEKEIQFLGVPHVEEEETDDPRVIWSMTMLYSVISLMGIVGNILVVVVVLTVPGMITPTNCYLVSLAISDCLFLIAAGPVELSYLHIDQSEYAFGAIGCKILTFLPYLGINTSSMSIMAFTVERFIGICHPLRARYICTVKRAKLIILFIWCFCILYNSPWLYLATLKRMGDVDGDPEECGFRLSRDNWTYKVVFVADFMTFYMLPMFLYMYIYGKICYTLSRCELKLSMNSSTMLNHNNNHNSHNTQRTSRCDSRPDLSATFTSFLSVGSPDSPPSPPNSKSHASNGTGQNHVHNNNNNISNNHSPREYFVTAGGNGRRGSTNAKGKMQVIKMLAVVVFIFAVCWLPYRAMVMYNSFASALGWPFWNSDWFIYMSKTMIFFNCAINPILYNLMSGRFRQAFLRLLSREKQYINSYKRDSICMQTTMGSSYKPLVGGDRRIRSCENSSNGMLLGRMAAGDAEVRATLLLKMQKDGVGQVQEIGAETTAAKSTAEKEVAKETANGSVKR